MKQPGTKDSHKDKMARNPIKIYPSVPQKKPSWLKIQLPHSDSFTKVKNLIRDHNLHTVCEEASCPNIGECFSKGTFIQFVKKRAVPILENALVKAPPPL